MDNSLLLPPEPSALSIEYHKARRQVMLWSGILLAWEFLGINLELAKSTEGSVGPIISAIKNPNKVPWVIIALTAYFLFKFTIEWTQCSHIRRARHASLLDFGSAWFAALLAIVMMWIT